MKCSRFHCSTGDTRGLAFRQIWKPLRAWMRSQAQEEAKKKRNAGTEPDSLRNTYYRQQGYKRHSCRKSEKKSAVESTTNGLHWTAPSRGNGGCSTNITVESTLQDKSKMTRPPKRNKKRPARRATKKSQEGEDNSKMTRPPRQVKKRPARRAILKTSSKKGKRRRRRQALKTCWSLSRCENCRLCSSGLWHYKQSYNRAGGRFEKGIAEGKSNQNRKMPNRAPPVLLDEVLNRTLLQVYKIDFAAKLLLAFRAVLHTSEAEL